MALGFQISAGTIPGRAHIGSGNLLVGKNNQDSFALKVFDNCIIATVHDGCSAGAQSELGAAIGGRLLVEIMHSTVTSGALHAVTTKEQADELFEKIRKRFLYRLAKIANLLVAKNGADSTCSQTPSAPQPNGLSDERRECEQPSHKYCSHKKVLHDCFLFTIFGLIVTSRTTLVFSIGDGLFALNGNVTKVGPFPGNAPPYVAYALLPSIFSYDAELLKFKIHAVVPTTSVDSLLVATDGLQDLIGKDTAMLPGKSRPLGNISQLWEDDRFFDETEHELITPWLRQINSEVVKLNRNAQLERSPGLLPDDTTLIAIRKKRGGE